jgi:CubicO group peptidase (beta-lactamase class C family)
VAGAGAPSAGHAPCSVPAEEFSLDGTVHPDFLAIADRLREQLRVSPGGAAVCVYHRGRCVVDLWGGIRDRDGRPWLADTMAPSFSTTKGIAATLVHILVDRGLLDYDEPIAKVWPEFAQNGKAHITLRQVLAHQSGLYHIRQMIDHADRMLDWQHMVHAIERAAPIHPPGERTGYHGLTFGFLVGEILQRVSGRSFAELVQQELVAPLRLDGMYVGASEAALPRAAELLSNAPREWDPQWLLGQPLVRRVLRQTGPALACGARLLGLQVDLPSLLDALAPRGINHFDFGSEETLRVSIPAANGLFTARSLARMYAALAGGGELEGVRLISRATLARATEPQAEARVRAVLPIDMRWRLGYHAVFTTRGVPYRAFGHFGLGGSGGWADPSRDLAVAMIVNSGSGTPFGDLRIARISGAALAAASRRGEAERAAAA